VAVPNLPRREVGRAGVYWRALGRARLQEHLGGDWGLPRYCPCQARRRRRVVPHTHF